MPEDSQQQPEQPSSIEQDQSVAWRQKQFEMAKRAMRGMLSRDFGSGGGEFIEPVQSGQPVSQYYPEDMALLRMASSTQIVSGNPDVVYSDAEDIVPQSAPAEIPTSQSVPSFDTGVGSEISGVEMPSGFQVSDPAIQDFAIEPVSIQEGNTGAGLETTSEPIPFTDASATIEDLPPPFQPSLAPIAPPPESVEPGLPEAPGFWPPGAGVLRTDTVDAQDPAAGGQDAPAAPQRPRQDQEQTRLPPVFMDGRNDRTIPNVDFGGAGDTFGTNPDATQNAHQEALGIASDAMGMAGEGFLEFIRMLTMMALRLADEIEELKDRLDTEDHADEW